MIYLLPLIAAFIGWLTNYLAVKMLFHPRKAIVFIGMKIQGVFPKRQLILAEKLGDVVAKELFSTDDLIQLIQQPKNQQAILEIVEGKVDQFIHHKLPEQMPMLAMFLNADLKIKIKNTLINEFATMIPAMLQQFGNDIKDKLDVKQSVQDKVSNFSSDKLEEILFSIMKKEFKFIELLGAVLGFIIGCIQLALVHFN